MSLPTLTQSIRFSPLELLRMIRTGTEKWQLWKFDSFEALEKEFLFDVECARAGDALWGAFWMLVSLMLAGYALWKGAYLFAFVLASCGASAVWFWWTRSIVEIKVFRDRMVMVGVGRQQILSWNDVNYIKIDQKKLNIYLNGAARPLDVGSLRLLDTPHLFSSLQAAVARGELPPVALLRT